MKKLPKKNKQRTLTHTVQFNEGELELVELAARKAGITVAELIRTTVLSDIRHRRGI